MPKKPDKTIKCIYCGREFIEPISHICNKNYRKRNLKWINLMEDKRKPFNAEKFISNEETPVETRIGNKVIIYNTNRVCTDDFYVCGDILCNGYSLVSMWLKDGHYFKNCNKHNRDLFFSIKKVTRRMTNQELSFWLMEHPEEHRETMFKEGDWISSIFNYNIKNADEEVSSCILIRSNGGSWREPLIGIEEEN